MPGRDTAMMERRAFGDSYKGSVALHLCIVGAFVLYAFIHGLFHGNEWGSNSTANAISATLVSAAPTLPLPQDHPPTPNVLATDNPSPAPALPQPKAPQAFPLDAIPIPAKKPPKPKVEKKVEQAAPKHPQVAPRQHRANYGQAPATQIPHSMAANTTQHNPVNINGGDFSSRFPWYVSQITRTVNDNWYRQEIDPSTPYGRVTRVIFTISRDGTPSNIRITQSSGSPTLDTSAVRAVQRVNTFGALPPQYRGSNVSVEYTFSYDQPNR